MYMLKLPVLEQISGEKNEKEKKRNRDEAKKVEKRESHSFGNARSRNFIN